MSIAAYIHMLVDQKLITRDIAMEYIAGYERARFGASRSEPLPVTLSPLHAHQPHQRPPSSLSGGRHLRQYSGNNSRHHPAQEASVRSTGTVFGGNHGAQPSTTFIPNKGECLEEEDYIRFMKVLSWILQELGWNQEEESYEDDNEYLGQERSSEGAVIGPYST